jgi:hypothetical protein
MSNATRLPPFVPNEHSTTEGARRLVRYLAGVYNGPDYPFDLTELRPLSV